MAKPNTDDLREGWVDVQARGYQMFALYKWKTTILPVLDEAEISNSPDCVLVQNAATESTLMSVRDLDDFFDKGPARNDDIRAHDYPRFASPGKFLSDRQRRSINKKLAHLTYQSARELRADPLKKNPRTWNTATIVDLALNHLFKFMDYLEEDFFDGDVALLNELGMAREHFESMQRGMNSIAASELEVNE